LPMTMEVGPTRQFGYKAGARPIEQASRYRNDPHGPFGPCLIQVDPRVCRGLTQAKHPVAPPKEVTQTRVRSGKGRSAAASLAAMMAKSLSQRDGRLDRDSQTEPYLQEAEVKPVLVTGTAQTDAFLDRPDPPIPFDYRQSDYVDEETQVEDLWDFDFEVKPIVDLLVCKALEVAFLEVHEEAELEVLREYKAAFLAERDAEIADLQRLEEAERRKQAEKERRAAQSAAEAAAREDLVQRIAAASFAEHVASNAMMAAITLLERSGFFYDEVEREINDRFLKWLGEEIADVNSRARMVQNIRHGVVNAAISFRHHAMGRTREGVEVAYKEDRGALLRQRRLVFAEDLAGRKVREARLAAAPAKSKKHDEEESTAE